MQSIAISTDQLRRRIRDGKVSMREIARKAGVSNSTVRRFVELGSGNVETVSRLEGVVNSLDAPGVSDLAVARTDVSQ